MKTKTVKKMTYEGLGFPIELKKVTMVEIDNEWHPKIDVRKVADATIKALVSQKERFTGNQVKFIRKYFSMSLREFGRDVVSESHTAVSKWEKCANQVTTMDINIEKMLRLFIYAKINLEKSRKRSVFYDVYLSLGNIHPSNKCTSQLQI